MPEDVKPIEPVTPAADPAVPAPVEPVVAPPPEPKPGEGAAPLVSESKPDDKSPEPPSEVKYELKLPENALLKKEDMDAIAAFAKEHKVAPEVAQKLLERENAAVSRFRQGALDAYQKQADEWKNQITKDPEIGGTEENFKKSLHLANRVLKEFGTEALTKELETTSMGNNPELTRVFVRFAKAIGEDRYLQPPKDSGHGKRKSDAELFWGKKD